MVSIGTAFAACSITATEHPAVQAQDTIIARDFVSIIRQIEYLPPGRTTLSLPVQPASQGQFLLALSDSLQTAGFAIREDHQVAGARDHEISVDRTRVSEINGQVVETFVVNVGQVSLRRSYAGRAIGVVRPVSAMQVKGLDASKLVLDTHVFDGSTSQTGTESELVQAELGFFAGSDSSGHYLQNVFDLGKSNFSNQLAGYSIVHEDILSFDLESDRLTALHEAKLAIAIDHFDTDLDVVSLIGCSNGAERQLEGQKLLALNRAETVRAALLEAGLPEERILWEGCWAGESYDQRMPPSGVVLAVKRFLS